MMINLPPKHMLLALKESNQLVTYSKRSQGSITRATSTTCSHSKHCWQINVFSKRKKKMNFSMPDFKLRMIKILFWAQEEATAYSINWSLVSSHLHSLLSLACSCKSSFMNSVLQERTFPWLTIQLRFIVLLVQYS